MEVKHRDRQWRGFRRERIADADGTVEFARPQAAIDHRTAANVRALDCALAGDLDAKGSTIAGRYRNDWRLRVELAERRGDRHTDVSTLVHVPFGK